MTLVENEITQKNIERARNNPEFEKYDETEHKLTPTNPELLEQLFKDEAYPVEQYYLSTPYDEFSLRVRASYKPEGTTYSGAQKSRGEQAADRALKRGEIPTDITADTFAYYKAMDLPHVHKLRTDVMEGVTVDFYDDPTEPVIVEVEHSDPEIRAYLLKVMQDMVGNTLIDRSDDPSLTNEAIAYRNTSAEKMKKPESLDTFTQRALAEMIAHYVSGENHVVLTLEGPSGSGKSTVTESLQEQIVELYGEAMRPVVVSTDDYHFGKKKLEELYGAPYMDWDDAKTYNTAELAASIEGYMQGIPLVNRHFDFETEEPRYDYELPTSSPFIIVEGLYAGSKDLHEVRSLHFELPTGLATSVGRDVRRLVIDNRANRAFPTPESRLRHQLETALPIYLERQKPERKSFSASVRPMAERAFMLQQLAR